MATRKAHSKNKPRKGKGTKTGSSRIEDLLLNKKETSQIVVLKWMQSNFGE
jgi:hypothetical protein